MRLTPIQNKLFGIQKQTMLRQRINQLLSCQSRSTGAANHAKVQQLRIAKEREARRTIVGKVGDLGCTSGIPDKSRGAMRRVMKPRRLAKNAIIRRGQPQRSVSPMGKTHPAVAAEQNRVAHSRGRNDVRPNRQKNGTLVLA